MSPEAVESREAAAPAVLLSVILGAAILRFAGLDSGLWYDEILTLVESVRLPLIRILTEYPGVNQHPLYSVLAHASIAAFGESAWALRLPACLAGVLCVPMAFVLARRLTSETEAWASAVVLATSYHHIWFSQNGRGYTLQGLFALCSTHMLLRAADGGGPRAFVLYVASSVAGIYTHPTMALVVAGHAAVFAVGRACGSAAVARAPLRPLAAAFAATAVVSALLYAPFAADILAVARENRHAVYTEQASAGWALSETLRSVLLGAGVPAALLGGALALVGALSFLRHRPLACALLLAPGMATALAVIAAALPFRPRFLFFLSGAAAIFVGRGIGVMVERLESSGLFPGPRTAARALVAIVFVIVSLSAPALARNYRLPKQDFDAAARFVEEARAQGATVAGASAACRIFAIYYRRPFSRCLESEDDWAAVRSAPRPTFVVYALPEYIYSAAVRARLRTDCPEVRRFPGTLGGGDIVVCDPAPRDVSR